MKNWEFLKIIYEKLKEIHNYQLIEQYKLRKEKLKSFIWVNLAVLSAIGVLVKFFKANLYLITLPLILNLISIALGIHFFAEDRTISTIDGVKTVKWLYKNVLYKINSEELFYHHLIRYLDEDVKKESGSFRSTYRIFEVLFICQITLIVILFFLEA